MTHAPLLELSVDQFIDMAQRGHDPYVYHARYAGISPLVFDYHTYPDRDTYAFTMEKVHELVLKGVIELQVPTTQGMHRYMLTEKWRKDNPKP